MSWEKKKRNTAAFLLRLLGVVILIGIITVMIPLNVPVMFGYQVFDVVSPSMEPSIPVGSLVIVKPAEATGIIEGDIVAYESSGVIIVHRVTHNNTFEGVLSTKGDSNPTEDLHRVAYRDVIGVVAVHLPLLGKVGMFVSSASGKLFFAELILLAAVLFLIGNRLKEKE
ncbi:MAG: signal peptidase I [Erysipelotrichaceae bacterium]|nr:signal peptidase I [Erysipelotrichaceae bacterium]